ncbi:MAG: hypothetical protein GTN76_17100 [Candidatus Aenigmarchaeota archaeon]|nr:hypothetical protein [Candidatus Aenigmarchaeota archaeon]
MMSAFHPTICGVLPLDTGKLKFSAKVKKNIIYLKRLFPELTPLVRPIDQVHEDRGLIIECYILDYLSEEDFERCMQLEKEANKLA